MTKELIVLWAESGGALASEQCTGLAVVLGAKYYVDTTQGAWGV